MMQTLELAILMGVTRHFGDITNSQSTNLLGPIWLASVNANAAAK
jgi:hypothetical protein